MGMALAASAEPISIGVRSGCRESSSAATPAACGAAAEVPKNSGKVPGAAAPGGKNVVSTPSGALMSGLRRMIGTASRLPDRSKKMGVPPADEDVASTGGLTPNAGVSSKLTAPTAIAPSAFEWP